MVEFTRAAKFVLLVILLIGTNIISSSCNRNSSEILCIDSEREALLKLKKELIDPSNRLSSWDIEEDCCKWIGISCDNLTGHVKELNLANKRPVAWQNGWNTPAVNEAFRRSKLKGKICVSILNLKHIVRLDLSDNDFGGVQLPSFFGSMVSLRYLNLTRAEFGGLIPHQLGNLSNLNHFGLRGTSSFQPLYSENLEWLHSLPSLLNLDLSYADLSKASSWLLDVNKVSTLQELHLAGCKLDLTAPLHPINLTSLLVLDISSNNFNSSLPKWISNLNSLVSLDLSQNEFQGPIPYALRNLTALSHLDLSRSGFNSSTIPNFLYTLHNLQHLILSSLNLKGGISNDITNLTKLVSIDLSMNELEGSIPSLANLCNLEHISLSSNKFAENITQIIESFSGCLMDSLISLGLSDNQISGHLTDQIGRLRNLSALYLAGNSISGSIPESIGNLSSLTILFIEDNELNGTLPKSMGSLSSLQVLRISNNHLEGTVSEVHFANLANLDILTMDENNLTLNVSTDWIPPFQLGVISLRSCILGPKFPKWLKSEKKYWNVDLSNTKISDSIPDWFWNVTSQSVYLNLSHNQLSGTIPDARIPIMDLRSNVFHGTLPRLLSNITWLDLSNNFFSGNISHFFCHSQSQVITILHLGNNLLSGNIPNCLKNWTSLTVLRLDNNKFSGKIPSSIESLTKLESLHLRNNSLIGVVPRSLKSCLRLKTLDLSLNEFHGVIPSWIGTTLSRLMNLGLRSNELSGLIPNELCHLSDLQILDIGDNNLTGPIPHCFGNFTSMATKRNLSTNIHPYSNGGRFLENAYVITKGRELEYNSILALMTSIDLFNNRLSGEIPQEITNLIALRSLNLSKNQLNGIIPENIGVMKDLESLDLSRNQLSGRIPLTMSHLSFLNHLNLSYNNFSGAIPSSTQLQGFNPSSFIGNELCGAPLQKRCGKEGETTETRIKEDEEDDESYIDKWFYLSLAIGFVFGFWLIWGPLLVSKTWRVKYFGYLASIWQKLK